MSPPNDSTKPYPERSARIITADRARIASTSDQSLWAMIRATGEYLAYDRYADFIRQVMSGAQPLPGVTDGRPTFPGVARYALLKAATEVFLMTNCGVYRQALVEGEGPAIMLADAAGNGDKWEHIESSPEMAVRFGNSARVDTLRPDWKERYLVKPGRRLLTSRRLRRLVPRSARAGPAVSSDAGQQRGLIPYMDIVRRHLGLPLGGAAAVIDDAYYRLVHSKLANPCLLELIWSYWIEEALVMQAMNVITLRFQNRRRPGRATDPLADLEIDPIRPLGSLLWGYIQDEQNRLSVARRAYEYDHHYGFTIEGAAVPEVRGADSRRRFLPVFHALLHECIRFYEQDDDTTRAADGFPVLKRLKDVHLVISEGADNQYGELPWTARAEMMMAQWILARPQMREFLGGRPMVAYPEPWMAQVETMNRLQRWQDVNIAHFHDLAAFGERLLLSIRFEAWMTRILPEHAANWARFWRPEIQGYIDAYASVTGVDLTSAPPADRRSAAGRDAPPSAHLTRHRSTLRPPST